jgi:hypothetical protein
MDTEKIEFARTSIKKSANFTKDPLIEFIILWIGLNALYNDGDDQENEKFKRYIQANKAIIQKILVSHKEEIRSLVELIYKTPQHSRIGEYIKTRQSFLRPDSDDSVLHFQQLIYKVRNNMFHSEKSWNKESEASLLKILNPVVKDMLSLMIKSYVG